MANRLKEIPWNIKPEWPEELLAFYHPETLAEIISLKHYFLDRTKNGTMDTIDCWIRMVAINRLTGHSNGFFSVYTMPPNQGGLSEVPNQNQ